MERRRRRSKRERQRERKREEVEKKKKRRCRRLLIDKKKTSKNQLTIISPSIRRSACSYSQIWTVCLDCRKRKIRFCVWE